MIEDAFKAIQRFYKLCAIQYKEVEDTRQRYQETKDWCSKENKSSCLLKISENGKEEPPNE